MSAQGPSAAEVVREWVAGHPVLDGTLTLALVLLCFLLSLVAATGCLYWLWYTIRLLQWSHVVAFVARPIPGIRRGKLGAGELELEALKDVQQVDARLVDAITAMAERLTAIEESQQAGDFQLGRSEHVSGNLRPSVGGQADDRSGEAGQDRGGDDARHDD